MTNKSSKMKLFSISLILLLILFVYSLKDKQLEWEYVKGFTVQINGDVEQIQDFYISLEKRLYGYPDWINIVLTGQLTNYRKDYAPYLISDDKFEYFNKIFTATNMGELLREYSKYIDSVFLNSDSNGTHAMEVELSKLYQFSSRLTSYFIEDKHIFLDDTINLMKFDLDPYYDPLINTSFVYIFLHRDESINYNIKEIQNQIQVEINDLNRFTDITARIQTKRFRVANIDTLNLLDDSHNYISSEFSHVYKYLPTINSNIFKSRMSLMKKNIYDNKNKDILTSTEFLNILSEIEEQIIEFQSRGNIHNEKIIDFLNELVGDGESKLGILTTVINILDSRRYGYLLEDYLSKSSNLLKGELKQKTDLMYPFTQNLPNKVASNYLDKNKSLLLNLKP